MVKARSKQERQAIWLIKGLQWMLDNPGEAEPHMHKWAKYMVEYCLTYNDVGYLEIMVSDLEDFLDDIRNGRQLRQRERDAGQAGQRLGLAEGQPEPPGG